MLKQIFIGEKRPVPKIGRLAPPFALSATEGELIRLEDYPKPVALVFMRHLA